MVRRWISGGSPSFITVILYGTRGMVGRRGLPAPSLPICGSDNPRPKRPPTHGHVAFFEQFRGQTPLLLSGSLFVDAAGALARGRWKGLAKLVSSKSGLGQATRARRVAQKRKGGGGGGGGGAGVRWRPATVGSPLPGSMERPHTSVRPVTTHNVYVSLQSERVGARAHMLNATAHARTLTPAGCEGDGFSCRQGRTWSLCEVSHCTGSHPPSASTNSQCNYNWCLCVHVSSAHHHRWPHRQPVADIRESASESMALEASQPGKGCHIVKPVPLLLTEIET